jgi:aminopeptidase N
MFVTLLFSVPFYSFAQIPDKGYDVIAYNATVKFDRQTDSLRGQVTMMARATTDLTDILQHAKYLTIDSVRINQSQEVSFGSVDTASGAYHLLVNTIPTNQIFTVTTFYHGRGMPEQYGSLPWGGVTDEDSMMFAMGVGFYTPYTGCTRHWLPCYDLPDDKADSVDLTFLCRASDVTASNGLLVSSTISNGWRTMHWHEGHPIATYLLTFATGPYTEQTITNQLGKPFEVYSLGRDSVLAAAEMNGRVAEILHFYDSLFAPYPFEKVGYAVTPFGSMEHQTMICLDKRVLGGNPATDVSDNSTVAVHELSHMWWGDWVTCKTFDDAWLNEGFARFCESLSLEHLFGRAAYVTRQHSNIAGAKTSVLPLFGAPTVDHHNSNYPYETIYQKGAVVLGMLRQYLGDSIFFASVRYYGNQHAYSTVTSADLEAAFEQVSGGNLSWFFKEWVFGRRYPQDTVTWMKIPNGAVLTFHQRLDTLAKIYFRVPIPVRFVSKNGQSTDNVIWMDSTQSSSTTIQLGFEPDTVKLDPEGLLLMRTVKITEQAQLNVPAENLLDKTFCVYPNPDRSGELLYLFRGSIGGEMHLILYTEAGQQVREWIRTNTNGSLNLEGLTSGTYRLAVLTASDKNFSIPVSIQR